MIKRILVLVAVIVAFEMVNYIPSEEATLKSANTLINEFNLFQVKPAGAEVTEEFLENLGIACMTQNRIKAHLPINKEMYRNTISIWEQSDKQDITGGALEYAPVQVATYEWAKDKKVTAILGKYVFYRMR